MEVSKFDQLHGYPSSLGLRYQKSYSSTWILWFKRQMDLEFMFSSIISLRTANWKKLTKLFRDLLALFFEYSVSIPTTNPFKFLQGSERNISTFLPLYIPSALMIKFFRFQLPYHTCLIKFTSLQLHHRTS